MMRAPKRKKEKQNCEIASAVPEWFFADQTPHITAERVRLQLM
jgi:hypothetical protein